MGGVENLLILLLSRLPPAMHWPRGGGDVEGLRFRLPSLPEIASLGYESFSFMYFPNRRPLLLSVSHPSIIIWSPIDRILVACGVRIRPLRRPFVYERPLSVRIRLLKVVRFASSRVVGSFFDFVPEIWESEMLWKQKVAMWKCWYRALFNLLASRKLRGLFFFANRWI